MFTVLSSLIVFAKMSGVQEINMADSHESKLDAVFKTIEALTARTGALENLASKVGTSLGAEIPQSTQHVTVEGPSPLPSQGNNCSNQNLDGGAAKYREPRVSLPKKFDDTRSKFRGFVNQVRLITILQPERYPTEQSQVGLVGTLLIGQSRSLFAPLFERRAPILNNFEVFLATFTEVFKDYDKACLATTKIRVLRQRLCPASVYVLDFKLLVCNITWDEEALMSQFHWGPRDESRKEQPLLQVGDKVWLLRHNIKTAQSYDKLEYWKIGPFPIQKQMNQVAYRLTLPASMKVHLVFHVSLLESYKESNIPCRTQPPPPYIKIDNHEEYEVEEVLDSWQKRD
jgi:hypothetical protein